LGHVLMVQPSGAVAVWRCAFVAPDLVLLPPVVRLGLGRRDVADGLQQAMVVEPRDPLQRRQFDRLARLPRSAPVDEAMSRELLNT
jgi:hypothetical protein